MGFFSCVATGAAAITDYGALPRAIERPDVLLRHGLSKNDITLIANWFFVDRNIANPAVLTEIASEIAFLSPSSFSFESGLAGLSFLLEPRSIAMGLTAIALAAITFKPRILLTVALCLGAMFFLGAIGRPGLYRVLLPTLCLLAVVSILHLTFRWWGQILAAHILLAAGLGACIYQLEVEVRSARATMTSIDAHRLASRESVVIWGSAIPYQLMYPPFVQETEARKVSLYGLGTLTFAPYSVALLESQRAQGLKDRLLSPEGIAIAMTSNQLALLKSYCQERQGSALRVTERTDLYPPVFFQSTCSRQP